MHEEDFKEYASKKNQVKVLTQELKELEPILTAGMVESGAEKVKTEFGSFTLREYTSVEISDEQKTEIKAIEKSIEDLPEVIALRKNIADIEATGKVVTKKGIMFR